MPKRWMTVYGIILTLVAVGQIGLAIGFYNPDGNTLVINLGWGVMMLSAIFGWLPMVTFRRHGEVQGRGYIRTTKLVDKGVYSIVRHPQYLAGILMSIALPMISQHWLVILPGVAAGVIYYANTFIEEQASLEKFGDAYRDYSARVPRVNFVLGILRVLFRR